MNTAWFHYNNGVAKVIPIHGGKFRYLVEKAGAGVRYFNDGDKACLFADWLAGLIA